MDKSFVKYPCLLLLALLLAACHGEQRQMRQALSDLQARNQADSLLTDDSLALALTRYFDRYGTPNERMEAHYLLGRTYADRGEAPQAIGAYQTAAEQADTTAPDCNYAQLCRVYSQMGYLLYRQNLMEDYIDCLEQSVTYAKIAGDTASMLNLQAQKMNAYKRIGNNDSVISIYERAYHQLISLGYRQMAAQFSAAPINCYLQKNEIEKAGQCIAFYESHSGYFDADGNIEGGRELFYFQKGNYFLVTHQFDSAAYYFRKELNVAKDFNNQSNAAKGLAQLYEQTNRPDSAAKYALYGYDMNDSLIALLATDEVANIRGLYNYSRFQRSAIEQRNRVEQEKRKSRLLITVFCALLAVGLAAFIHWRKKRLGEKRAYLKKIEELAKSLADTRQLISCVEDFESLVSEKEKESGTFQLKEMLRLQEQSAELNDLIRRKELKEAKLKDEIARYRKRDADAKKRAEEIKSSPVCIAILNKSVKGERMSENEWEELNKQAITKLPELCQFLLSHRHQLSIQEYKVCVLLRLKISNQAIANLLGVSAPYVSQVSKNILKKLFNAIGATKELSVRLSAL